MRLNYDPVKGTILAPVRYEVQPERIVGVGEQGLQDRRRTRSRPVKQGLRASLQSASLITG